MDEIHTIGQESGATWEQILLLAPCPIMQVPRLVLEYFLTQSCIQWSICNGRRSGSVQPLASFGTGGTRFQAYIHPPSSPIFAPTQVLLSAPELPRYNRDLQGAKKACIFGADAVFASDFRPLVRIKDTPAGPSARGTRHPPAIPGLGESSEHPHAGAVPTFATTELLFDLRAAPPKGHPEI